MQKRVVRIIMTFSDLRLHSEPLLKSLRLLKFSDMIHLESHSFLYQWSYLPFIPIIHVNHRMIICLLNQIIPLTSSETQGQSVGSEVCKYGQKSPWVPTLTELFPKIQADAGSLLGTKNALYYCAQSANSFS